MALGYEDITQWSTTALNNGNSDSAITWVEHQPRNTVNDSARSVMAALAKTRDMTNGSIITGGTANAQTVTTPVNFAGVALPLGLRLRVKVGAGLTNTATGLTLSVDGSTVAGVKNLRGQSPVPGEWLANSFVDMVYDGTYWNMISALPGVFTPDNMNCGRFVYQTPTTCALLPFNGSQIKINGQVYQIPSSGITFGNTGVLVNGVPGTSLGANTTYWVGVYDPGSGVLTQSYGTTGAVHTIDTTLGNVGTHIMRGTTTTLVGLIHTNASKQFVDIPANRFVLSWFNKQKKAIRGPVVAGVSISGGGGDAVADIGASTYSLIWGDGETGAASVSGCFAANWNALGITILTTSFGGLSYMAMALDGINQGTSYEWIPFGESGEPHGSSSNMVADASEGLHTLSLNVGSTTSDTIQAWGQVVSEVWG